MSRVFGKPATIHKTVRLTQKQIDLIESQGQDTFTANLDYLLNELLSGETDRARSINEYQKCRRLLSEEISRLHRYIYACANYVSGLEEAVRLSLGLEKLLQEEGYTLQHPDRRKLP